MEIMDIIIYVSLGTILIVASIMYLLKKGRVKKSIKKADKAILDGDDSLALLNFISALLDANETPDLELEILNKIENLYNKNHIQYDFSNYRDLVENSRVLLKKASKKSEKELSEIENLKQKIRSSIPSIKEGDIVAQMREMSKEVIENLMKK